jgi:hypothetical protein
MRRYFLKALVAIALVPFMVATVQAQESIRLGLILPMTGPFISAKFAPLDQFCFSPQCGFASTEEGNVLAEDEQWAKLSRIVEVTIEVWG